MSSFCPQVIDLYATEMTTPVVVSGARCRQMSSFVVRMSSFCRHRPFHRRLCFARRAAGPRPPSLGNRTSCLFSSTRRPVRCPPGCVDGRDKPGHDGVGAWLAWALGRSRKGARFGFAEWAGCVALRRGRRSTFLDRHGRACPGHPRPRCVGGTMRWRAGGCAAGGAWHTCAISGGGGGAGRTQGVHQLQPRR